MKIKKSMPISISFKPNLRTDGEFCKVKISQLQQELVLTEEQAIALGRTLFIKFGERITHD